MLRIQTTTLVLVLLTAAVFRSASADEYLALIWADVAIDASGNVTDVDVIAGLPDPILKVISDNVSSWAFEPALQDGKPVPSTTAVFTEVAFAENESGDVTIRVEQVRSGARPVINPPPVYPDALRGDAVEGSVELQYMVMANGSVSNVTVANSSPEGVFDDIAVEAVQGWSFKPRTVNGIPINSPVRQIIEFKP